MFGLNVEKLNLKYKNEKNELEAFLNKFGLELDKDVDCSLVIREAGEIKATCSKAKNVLKCFAVDEALRGEGITNTLITELINKLFEEGIYHSFIFTKPGNVSIFSSLGYELIHQVKDVALLENGIYTINSYLDKLIKKYNISDNKKAALVMNCNPFTLGHRYLIEKASEENEEVIVFIVEEDKSLFPFETRFELVKKGTEHLKNVTVIPGGEYIISSATFPSYFLREEGPRLRAYTELDAGIFAKYFCSKLNITKRYVGTEPYDKVTNAYNEALRDVLSQYGIDLRLVQRKKQGTYEISASTVRKLIKEDNFEELKFILPKTSLEFLSTTRGNEIIEKIKVSNTPH
jgi:[citrate (pro-3S)-lyase] ligase